MSRNVHPRCRRVARVRGGLALTLTVAVLASCAQKTDPETSTAEPAARATEASSVTPRLAITYDGGIRVLDASSLELVRDIDLEGFNRLSPAGDERHIIVSTTGGFEVLDAGTWAEPHGDHAHYYTSDPRMTGTKFGAEVPGHVVSHANRTTLFDDGTGEAVVVDSDKVSVDGKQRRHTTPDPHHGVAVELSDGSLVVSEGTAEHGTGVRVLDADNRQIAASANCPGVHGGAVAADETVVIGCEDGVLTYADGNLTKIASPDDYGRIGNQAGSEKSPVVLGDYKTDPDADLERPTRVSLVNTDTNELRLVDLPASYSFRSLARGENGEALVLGTDGKVHVINPRSGELTRSIPVIDRWKEPQDWQSPRPSLFTLAGSAYVTDPSTGAVHAVDITEGKVWRSADLEVTPNEITGVTGDVDDDRHGTR